MQEEYTTPAETNFSSKRKFILVTLGIIVILLLGLLCVANAFPQLIFSPKMMYLGYEYKNFQGLQKDWNEYLENSFVKDSMQAFEKPTKSSTIVKFDFSTPVNSDPNTLQIYNLLKKSQLTLDQYIDVKNQKDKSSISFKMDGKNFVSLDTFSSSDKMGISLSPIYDKYITFDKNNLKEVYEKLQIKDGPSKIISGYDLLKIVKFSKEDQDYIKTKLEAYGKIATDNVDKKDVTFTSKYPVTLDGITVNTKLLSLKLDQQKLRNIYIKILESMSTDDKLLNITIGKYADLLNLYKDANYSIDEDVINSLKDVSSTKKLLADTINKLKQETENNSSLVINIYVDKNSNTVKREIKFIENQTNTPTFAFDYTKLAAPNSENYKISSNIISYADGQKESSISMNGYENKKEQKFTVSSEDSTFDILRTIQKDKGIDLKFDFKDNTDIYTITYKLNKNLQNNSLDAVMELIQNTNNKIIITSNINYNSPFNIPDVSTKELDLNKTSAEQLQQEFTKIYLSGLQFIQQNSSLFY